MKADVSPDFRYLETESSNHLMEHDSRRALGRYEEAAFYALQAGNLRSQMAQIDMDTAEYSNAVEDLLSAAECFLLGTADDKAKVALVNVQELIASERLSGQVSDFAIGLEKVHAGVQELLRRKESVLRGFGSKGYRPDVAGPARTLGVFGKTG